jgi:hypothetical protein
MRWTLLRATKTVATFMPSWAAASAPLIELPGQVVAGLDTVKAVEDVGVAAAQAPTAAVVDEIAPGMIRQRPEPATKAACPIIGEGPHLIGEPRQDHLRDVLGVGILQPPLATPAVNLAAVAVDKLGPSRLIGGRPP